MDVQEGTTQEGRSRPRMPVKHPQPLHLSLRCYTSNQRNQGFCELFSVSLCSSQIFGEDSTDNWCWLWLSGLFIVISNPNGVHINSGHFHSLSCYHRYLQRSQINHLESWCSPVTLIKLCFASESCICSVCTVCKLYKLQEKLISVIQTSAQLLKLTMNTNYPESLPCGWKALHTNHVTKFTEVGTKASENMQWEQHR